MTRSSGDPQPSMTWPLVSGVLVVVLLVLIVIALSGVLRGGGGSDATPTPSRVTRRLGAALAAGSTGPSSSPSAAPSSGATSAGTRSPSAAASATPRGSSAAPSASASSGPDASACSGSDDNRSFFAEAADALSFEVYCAVLPSGWTLTKGSYRGAAGGRVEIAYRGPGGATLRLREGPAACADDPSCPPSGTEIGAAAFGDRPGTISTVEAGYAIVATELPLLYIAETTGLDQAASTALAAALVAIR